MDEDAGFLHAIQAKPGDTDFILIYADWLEENGDPRAEYLRLRIALERLLDEAKGQELSTRLCRLRGSIAPAWLATLDRTLPPWPPLRAALDLVWSSGGEVSAQALAEMTVRLSPSDQLIVRQFTEAMRQEIPTACGLTRGSISTKNLAPLPDIDELRRRCQSLAVLEAILDSVWRHYTFTTKLRKGVMAAWFDNHSYARCAVYFNQAGALIKGYAKHHPMLPCSRIAKVYYGEGLTFWPGVVDQVPIAFKDALSEPYFEWEEWTTFCIWRQYGDSCWRLGDVEFPKYSFDVNHGTGGLWVKSWEDPDGSGYLLNQFHSSARSYRNWAEEYYERDLDENVVEQIYRHHPLTLEMAQRLNPQITVETLKKGIKQIGYPKMISKRRPSSGSSW